MTNNLKDEIMYCSEDEYDSDSDQPNGEEALNYEFDDYDGNVENLDDYESRTTVPEAPSNRWSNLVQVHGPVQLAALTSEYETIEEGCNALWETMMQKESEDREARLKAFEEKLVQDRIDLVKFNAFLSTFPTESEDGKAKRLEKKKLELAELLKAKTKNRKLGTAALPFPHRRNGGGKHSKKEPATTEVIAARRALHRSQTKKTKKEEEEARTKKFAVEGPQAVKAEKVYVTLPILVEDEMEKTETDEIRVKMMEKATIIVEEEIVQEIVEKKKKVVEEEWTKVTKKTTIEPLVIKMGVAPYRSPSSWKDRPTAARVERTRMCNSVIDGKKCYHGEKCRFAHSIDELNIQPCRFGSNCRSVYCGDNVYKNNTTMRVCQFSHPEETKNDYADRVGIAKHISPPAPTPPPAPPPQAPPPPAPPPQAPPQAPPPAAWTKPQPVWKPPSPPPQAPPPQAPPAAWTKPQPVWKPPSPPPQPVPQQKMCFSVGSGIPCPHGSRCRFFHPPLHSPIVDMPPLKMSLEKMPLEKMPLEKMPLVEKMPLEKMPLEKMPLEKMPLEKAEVVITVPSNMAPQALEMILSKGLKNVRLNVY
jgi:hypothetical protein